MSTANIIGNAIFGLRNKSGGNYINPAVKESLVGLWKFDQNTNESPTRNIIKNTIKDKGGDLELLNFGYKLNSGYGKYIEDFSLFTLSNRFEYSEISNTKVTITAVLDNSTGIYHVVTEENSALYWNTFKIKVSGSTDDVYISYTTAKKNIRLYNGINTVVVPNELSWHTFSASKANTSCNITLEFVPLYEGALVTDGKDDMIVSQKTVQEMLGGSNACTVVSMITHISGVGKYNFINAGRMQVTDYVGQTFITANNSNSLEPMIIELGDKGKISKFTYPDDLNYKLSICCNEEILEMSSCACYFVFMFNKVNVPIDWIRQVIAYYKLDKYVTPQVIYDVKRQGLTNDTPAADWYLKDFSGNGHDMQLYNYAKTPESGINEEGGLQSDGVNDYGKAEGLPIFKDYTVAIDRAWTNDLIKDQCLASKLNGDNFGSFSFELIENGFSSYSFGISNKGVITIDSNKKISYQSKYVYNGSPIISGNNVDGKDLFLFRNRDSYPYYAKAAIWSYILFPYTLSEFLLERQLKKYKLGTLYPDMVELRPIIKGGSIFKYLNVTTNEEIFAGDYIHVGDTIRFYVSGISGTANEVSSFTVNGVEGIPKGNHGDLFDAVVTKSPQKINITIDEYIRYEDIVQPYPAIINLKQDGKTITWGDKLKVGSEVTFVNHTNLLPDLYTVSGGVQYNGTSISWNTSIRVEKSMVFVNPHNYKKANEPNCILAPQTLRIPNSSYKILGYIPDLTGKGNHGRLNNFAYTEESGANEDGSIRFDGVDDYITIPTLAHGGKQVLMKVNLQSYDRYLYDQRNSWSQYLAIVSAGKTIAYEYSNKGGKTYIDGILNEHIIDKDLLNITHNITATNANIGVQYAPNIGTSFARGNFAQMALFDFMLFPEISSENEIKELNDIVGIEGGYVESPNYYWDAYGKKNTDTDRNLIADQVSKDVANALEVKNVAYNSESGYTDNNGLLLDGVEDHAVNTVIPAVTDFTVIAKREWLGDYQPSAAFVTKGTSNTYTKAAFMMEYKSSASIQIGSFGILNSGQNMPDLITYMTPIDYNKAGLSKGTAIDENGLIMGKYSNTYYWKGVFYKMMLYTKTIDQLSINMLKNLFERDELIDVTNPIFKKQ